MKQYFYHWLVGVWLLSAGGLYAQKGNDPVGARAVGMGDAAVTLQDQWSVFNNIGGLAGVTEMMVVAGYENRFGIAGFQTFSAGIVTPLNNIGVAGLTLARFGDELYSEQKYGLGFSHRLGIVSLGLKVNYVQVAVQELGGTGAVVVEFGGVAEITPNLFFGAHIYNLNRGKFRTFFEDELLPVVLKTGLSYRPFSSLMINIEAMKDLEQEARFKAGLEYLIIPKVQLRTGLQTQPVANFFGVGFTPKRFQVDYAMVINQRLGFMQHVAVSYRFGQ
ncbi:hypothetical protein [Eisenibacter elegans]|uniref:hypothetical protein n=1 Tax=Eisenibacter elegans TaxID=997 RepID=UPI00042849DA|nr:hypothetical protein [Eisenibacter elegans]